jgi:hypothetical protein
MTQGAVAASRCGAIGSGVGTGHHRAVAVLKPRGPRETVQIRSLFWPVCEDAFDTSCVSHWLTGQTGRRTVRSAGSRSSSIVHSRSSQARLAQSALLRPPRAAPAAYTGFATARRGFSTAQRAQLVERSYTREARLLKVPYTLPPQGPIAEFAGCGSSGRSAATKARATQAQARRRRSWWLVWWQSHRLLCRHLRPRCRG